MRIVGHSFSCLNCLVIKITFRCDWRKLILIYSRFRWIIASLSGSLPANIIFTFKTAIVYVTACRSLIDHRAWRLNSEGSSPDCIQVDKFILVHQSFWLDVDYTWANWASWFLRSGHLLPWWYFNRLFYLRLQIWNNSLWILVGALLNLDIILANPLNHLDGWAMNTI